MNRTLRDECWFLIALVGLWLVILAIAWAIVAFSVGKARAEDHRHPTETITGATAKFYETWKRPDQPSISCCNLADCYATPSRHKGGHIQALHRESGDWIDVPAEKVELDRDSPDGMSHLCARPDKHVYCFVFGAGG